MNKKTKVATGISGLDEILFGGFPKGSITLVQGAPGTGKTTLGLQFLVEGARQFDESGIYITFEELPEQLYHDASSFGWDLRELESKNKLRVICLEPDVLLEQITSTNGLIEAVIKEIDCKRLVIDSISLYKVLNKEIDARNKVYTLRNVLRKFAITTFFISEAIGIDNPLESNSFENYLSDGVIHLSLCPYMEKYRKRTIEVLKMRGTKIHEGEHRYKFLENGIHIIPALSMAEDKSIISQSDTVISTGIDSLDEILHGGLPRGSVFTIDTNSKANYRYIITSLLAKRLEVGDKVITMMTNISTIEIIAHSMKEYDINLKDAINNKNAYFVELFKRDIPDDFKDGVVHISDVSETGFQNELREKFSEIIKNNLNSGGNWFVYYDLNILVNLLGKEFTQRFFAEEALRCRMNGITMLAHCNFAELSPETASVFERASNGIIRTWVDGNYQMLQVTKSPTGRMSAPLIIENIASRPYIRMV